MNAQLRLMTDRERSLNNAVYSAYGSLYDLSNYGDHSPLHEQRVDAAWLRINAALREREMGFPRFRDYLEANQ